MNVITAAALCFAIQTANTDGRISLKEDRVAFACEHTQAIIETSAQYNIDPVIMASLIYYESRYEPSAVSRSNACGLTQVLPKYVPETCKQLKDPLTSIAAGTRSLSYWMVKRKKKTYEVALACYNAGNACLSNSRGKSYSSKVRSLSRWLTSKATTYKHTEKINYTTIPPSEILKTKDVGGSLAGLTASSDLLSEWAKTNEGGSHIIGVALVEGALESAFIYTPHHVVLPASCWALCSQWVRAYKRQLVPESPIPEKRPVVG